MRGPLLLVCLSLLAAVSAERLDVKYQLWPKIVNLPEIQEKETFIIDDTKSSEKEGTQEQMPKTQAEEEEDMSYDTFWYNGTHTRTIASVKGEAKFEDYTEEELKAHGIIEPKTNRVRRMVFGQDTRFKVARKYTQVYPFTSLVKLSTGCSGTLVSPRHVLTAAHCVKKPKIKSRGPGKKKGGDPNRNDKPSVGFVDRKGDIKYIPVKNFKIPQNWKKKRFQKFDYALLELMRKVDRPYMELGVLDTSLLETKQFLHFNAFDSTKPSQIMYRFCNISKETHEFVYSKCDSSAGSDGAGVYIRLYDVEKDVWQRKIVGIYSANENTPIDEKHNAALRITPLKFAHLCRWMTGKYEGCKGK